MSTNETITLTNNISIDVYYNVCSDGECYGSLCLNIHDPFVTFNLNDVDYKDDWILARNKVMNNKSFSLGTNNCIKYHGELIFQNIVGGYSNCVVKLNVDREKMLEIINTIFSVFKYE